MCRVRITRQDSERDVGVRNKHTKALCCARVISHENFVREVRAKRKCPATPRSSP